MHLGNFFFASGFKSFIVYTKKKKEMLPNKDDNINFSFFLNLHYPGSNKNEVIVQTIIDLGLNGSRGVFHPVLPSQSTGQIFSNAG